MDSFKATLTENELAELLRPKLRLFLSVDVVGSTAFKHNSEHSKTQGWLDFSLRSTPNFRASLQLPFKSRFMLPAARIFRLLHYGRRSGMS